MKYGKSQRMESIKEYYFYFVSLPVSDNSHLLKKSDSFSKIFCLKLYFLEKNHFSHQQFQNTFT